MRFKKNKQVAVLLIICATILLVGCQKKERIKITAEIPAGFDFSADKKDTREVNLVKFLDSNFLKTNGIVTSIGRSTGTADQASGKEFLLESSSLWLLHLVYKKEFKKFRLFYVKTKKVFYNKGLFSYRYNSVTKRRFSVNASGDDLRLMRALIAYDEATSSNYYHSELEEIFNNWQEKCFQHGELRDFYDLKSHRTSDSGSLAYADLQTLYYLNTKKKYYRKTTQFIKAAYLGDALPLYFSSYNWNKASYDPKNLNTSEALEVLLQLARVDKLKPTSISWLVVQLDRKRLPNSFSPTGKIIDENESAANWALVAQIFAVLHDTKHYNQAMKIVWSGQITQKGNMFGGFGDINTGTAFSYNNLNVLLAADAKGQAYAEN